MTDPGPALQGRGTATWSTKQGTAFEVAVEGINHVVGRMAW
ncbi:hypothetical protein [Streptomyces sp. NPDC046859]